MRKCIIYCILLAIAVYLSADLSEITFSVSSEIDSMMNVTENINILIPVTSLIFKKQKDNFYSSLNIQYSFLDKHNNPIKSFYIDTSIILNNYGATVSDSIFAFNKAFATNNNYSKMNIAVYDINSSNSIRFESKILLPYSKENKSFIKGMKPFKNNNWHYLNTDSITFIIDYHFIDSATYNTRIDLKDEHGNLKTKFIESSSKKSDTVNISANINTGKYILSVKLMENKKEISSMYSDFYIDFSFSHSDKEYNDILNALSNIAVGTEITRLRLAPREEREDMWIDFWNRAEKNPILSGNVTYYDFLGRYQYVEKHFAVYSKQGYKTDFGRIYLIYGKPDEIESHPFDMESKPYVIWYYYSLGYEFQFVDIYGYGEYMLVNYYEQLR